MVFAWDENKDRLDRRKHGVSFETAAQIFREPLAISYFDRFIDGEQRGHIMGTVNGIEAFNEEKIRIISARKANSRERSLYYASH